VTHAPLAADARMMAGAAALLAGSVVGVHRLQPVLALETHAVKETDDVYLFPPPSELRAATLGYIAASTDILWAKLLVEHGTHWAEHRPFPDLNRYLDAINNLDPTFVPFYEFVDTLLCFRPPRGDAEDARAARVYLERGIKVLPYDPEVWLHYGQFIGFLAPSFLTDDVERQAWRHDGAVALTWIGPSQQARCWAIGSASATLRSGGSSAPMCWRTTRLIVWKFRRDSRRSKRAARAISAGKRSRLSRGDGVATFRTWTAACTSWSAH